MNADSAKVAISEENNYARHIFTSAVSWYAFFAAVNYTSMGWLANGDHTTKETIAFVSILFITQNVLGIAACMGARRYFNGVPGRLTTFYQALGEEANGTAVADYYPSSFYKQMMLLMICAMYLILLSWALFPFMYQHMK